MQVSHSPTQVVVILIFIATFVLPSLLDEAQWVRLSWFCAFWRTGTVIWGGGQVVLPLLENEVVPTGWVDQSVFFSGLALAQARRFLTDLLIVAGDLLAAGCLGPWNGKR